MINKNFIKENTDIVRIYKETEYALIASVRTIHLGSHLAVLSKKIEGERYYASSMEEANAICRALEPIPLEVIESMKEKADSLAIQIKEVLKEKNIECKSHVYDYNTDYEYGLPCVKLVSEDNLTAFLSNSDVKYKFLSKMNITDSEINAIAQTLSQYYRKPISVIKDGLRIKTYTV